MPDLSNPDVMFRNPVLGLLKWNLIIAQLNAWYVCLRHSYFAFRAFGRLAYINMSSKIP